MKPSYENVPLYGIRVPSRNLHSKEPCDQGANLQDLGRRKRHIRIVQRQDVASVPTSPGGDATGGDKPRTADASTSSDFNAGALWNSSSSGSRNQPRTAVSSVSSAPHSGNQDPGSSLSSSSHQDLQQSIAEAKKALADATSALQGTSASKLISGLQQQMQQLREVQKQVQGAGSAVQDGKLRKALKSRRCSNLFARRSLPWLWSATPGVSASVQLGAAVRTPLQPNAVWRALRQARQSAAVSATSEDTSLRTDTVSQGRGLWELWGRLCEPIMPVVRPSRAQPILLARLEATVGKFRRIALDHTSTVLEVETCCRGSGAASVGPAILTGRRPAGMYHAVSFTAKQQIVGPLRAFTDMRWEVRPGVGQARAGAAPEAAAGGTRVWLQSLTKRCQSLQAERVGCNVGVDVCLGVAHASVWYSLTKRQGMIEFRL